MKARIIISGYPREVLFSLECLLNLPRALINIQWSDKANNLQVKKV